MAWTDYLYSIIDHPEIGASSIECAPLDIGEWSNLSAEGVSSIDAYGLNGSGDLFLVIGYIGILLISNGV